MKTEDSNKGMHSDKNCIPFALREVHTLDTRMVAGS
jgi:hypothetical protein